MLTDYKLLYIPYRKPKGDFHTDSYPHFDFRPNGKGGHECVPLQAEFTHKLGPVIPVFDDSKSELLVDLQTSTDCFCADLVDTGKTKFVSLYGSGWMEIGYPHYCDTSVTDGTSRGHYLALTGKAMEIFCKLSKGDCLPNFHQCFAEENYSDLHDHFWVPDDNYKTECYYKYEVEGVSYPLNVDEYLAQVTADFFKRQNLDRQSMMKLSTKKWTALHQELQQVKIKAEVEIEKKNEESRQKNRLLFDNTPINRKLPILRQIVESTENRFLIWNVATYFGFFVDQIEYEEFLREVDE